MTITKTIHGAWECSDILGGYRVNQTYYGYTKREAVALFREYCRTL